MGFLWYRKWPELPNRGEEISSPHSTETAFGSTPAPVLRVTLWESGQKDFGDPPPFHLQSAAANLASKEPQTGFSLFSKRVQVEASNSAPDLEKFVHLFVGGSSLNHTSNPPKASLKNTHESKKSLQTVMSTSPLDLLDPTLVDPQAPGVVGGRRLISMEASGAGPGARLGSPLGGNPKSN